MTALTQLYRLFRFLLTLALLAAPLLADRQPNVLLIVCDDLNDYLGVYGGHPQAQSPHLDRFAETAVTFDLAYSNNPVCAPSRASFLSGIHCHNSGNFFWKKWQTNSVLKNSHTLSEHFKENGYYVAGSGKLMHVLDRSRWNEYPHQADYGPMWEVDKKRAAHPDVPEPYASIGAVDGSFGSFEASMDDVADGKGWVYGRWDKRQVFHLDGPNGRSRTPDEGNADWAALKLREFAKQPEQPFFLAVGFIRPHTPMVAPQEYFDRFPLESLQLPVLKDEDVRDTYLWENVNKEKQKGFKYYRLLEESYAGAMEGLKRFLQAYLACVAAVDDNIGTVLQALEASPFADNTIVIITSDHGWNMGEKYFLFKNSPWEESTRVPLLVRAPGVSQAGARVEVPVSLIDLFPTLVDLCELPAETRKNEQGRPLDGHSLRPLLEKPARGQWEGPSAALTMLFNGNREVKTDVELYSVHQQHYTIRTKRYRYVRYANGKEELYDHENDPYEWTNLAGEAAHAALLQEHRKQLKAMLPPDDSHLADVNFGTWK